MMAKIMIVMVCNLLVLVSSCGISDPIECSAEFVYGVSVEIKPAKTISEWEGTVLLMAENYEEQLRVKQGFNAFFAAGAGERSGVYKLRVDHPGYKTWEQEGIAVSKPGPCHVIGVSVTVELEAD